MSVNSKSLQAPMPYVTRKTQGYSFRAYLQRTCKWNCRSIWEIAIGIRRSQDHQGWEVWPGVPSPSPATIRSVFRQNDQPRCDHLQGWRLPRFLNQPMPPLSHNGRAKDFFLLSSHNLPCCSVWLLPIVLPLCTQSAWPPLVFRQGITYLLLR